MSSGGSLLAEDGELDELVSPTKSTPPDDLGSSPPKPKKKRNRRKRVEIAAAKAQAAAAITAKAMSGELACARHTAHPGSGNVLTAESLGWSSLDLTLTHKSLCISAD